MQPGIEDEEFRISDSDRDQISEVLSEHAAEGRLTMDELDQRIGVLYAATTRAQAAAVVADLPPLTDRQSPHHFHLGHEDDDATPALPDWLAAGRPAPAPPSSPVADLRPQTPAAHEDKAALRRQAKLRQDENAIGHTFQATRRGLNAKLESATSSSRPEEVDRLNQRLREAQETAAAARQALAAGDRAEVQRRLAQLRSLA